MPEGISNVARYLPELAASSGERVALRIPSAKKSFFSSKAAGGDGYLSLSYARVEQLASGLAHAFAARGIRRNMRVLLMLRPGRDLILVVFALFKMGAVPVVIDPGMGLKAFRSCVARTQPEALIGIPAGQIIARLFRRDFASVTVRITLGGRVGLADRMLFGGRAFSAARSGDASSVCGDASVADGANTDVGIRGGKMSSDACSGGEMLSANGAPLCRTSAGAALCHTSAGAAASAGRPRLGEDRLESLVRGQPEHFEPVATQTDDLAAILFTSGSTGSPKGVRYEHGMFEAQVRMVRETYGIEPGEVDLPLLPVFALFGPALGFTSVVPTMNPGKPASVDPALLVRAIEDNAVTNSFGSPVLWTKIAAYCEAEGKTLPSLRRVLMAGAPAHPTLLRRMLKLLPNGEVHTPYGATEVLPVSSISAREVLEGTALLTQQGWGTCVGRLLPGVRARIIAISDGPIADFSAVRELPVGHIGEIVVTGPSVTRAYDNLPEATAQAKIFDRAEGTLWHRMGDAGMIDTAGRLWFCGRKAERVQVGFPTGARGRLAAGDSVNVTQTASKDRLDATEGSFSLNGFQAAGRIDGTACEIPAEAPAPQVALEGEGVLFTDCVEGIMNTHPQVFRTALVGVAGGGGVVVTGSGNVAVAGGGTVSGGGGVVVSGGGDVVTGGGDAVPAHPSGDTLSAGANETGSVPAASVRPRGDGKCVVGMNGQRVASVRLRGDAEAASVGDDISSSSASGCVSGSAGAGQDALQARQVPHLMVEPWPQHWPKTAAEVAAFKASLRELADRHGITRPLADFHFRRRFPVDVRHNAKIHRLDMAKELNARLATSATQVK